MRSNQMRPASTHLSVSKDECQLGISIWPKLGCLLPVILLSIVPVSSSQAEWNLSLGAGLGYTDNQFRESSSPSESSSIDALIFVEGSQAGPRLDASLDANLNYGVRESESKGDLLGALKGALEYRPLPKYLHFTIEDTFGQIQRSLVQPDNPDNRFNFNVLSIGPNILIPFGKRSGLDLGGRWIRSYYEKAPANSTSKTFSASLKYALTNTRTVLLMASNNHVDYDNLSSAASYNIQEGGLRYLGGEARSTLDLLVGATRVRFADRELPASVLVRATVGHDFSAHANVTVAVGTQYNDSGNNFVIDQSLAGVDAGVLIGTVSTDAIKSEYAGVSTRLSSARIGLVAGAQWTRASHDTQTSLDSTQQGVYMTISRSTSPRVVMRVEGRYGKRELVQPQFDFADQSAGLGINWQASSKMALDFDVQRFTGVAVGSGTLIKPYDFRENRASLRLFYSPNR